MENFGNDFETTLLGTIDADDLVINVASGAGAPAVNFRIRIGNEILLVTDKGGGTNWTVQRAVEGSVAAAHGIGSLVTHIQTAGGFQQWMAEALAAFVSFNPASPGPIGGALADMATFTRVVVASGAIVASTPALAITQTWNNAGVAFKALTVDITDTASTAGSLLADLKVGGQTVLSVDKAGAMRFPTSSAAAITIPAVGNWVGALGLFTPLGITATLSTTALNLVSGVALSWANNAFLVNEAANLIVQRNGTNAQAWRQYATYTDASNHEYITTLFVSTTSTVITTVKLGTGVQRNLSLGGSVGDTGGGIAKIKLWTDGTIDLIGLAATRWSITTTGALMAAAGQTVGTSAGDLTLSPFTGKIFFGTVSCIGLRSATDMGFGSNGKLFWTNGANNFSSATQDLFLARGGVGILDVAGAATGAALQMTEMAAPAAPAADQVRLYIQDNGAGKTQLMALFSSGAAQQLAIQP